MRQRMRESLGDSPLGQEAKPGNSPSAEGLFPYVRAYWKLVVGILLGVLLVSFVVQNADAVRVRFLVWEAAVSQAWVVFLALSAGAALGAVLRRRQRQRSSSET